MNIENCIADNWDKILVILIAYLTLILPIYKFIQDKRKEERNKRFENYHKLIDTLVGGKDQETMLDRQIAIIFEFRNFKEYYPVTIRILTGLQTDWQNENQRLIEEMKLTKQYISYPWFCRKFKFRKK